MCSSKRSGPPKHQNKIAWKPNAGRKINETEVGGRFRPLSDIPGVCPRCKEQIEWKRHYGKSKSSDGTPADTKGNRVGQLFPNASLEDYAKLNGVKLKHNDGGIMDEKYDESKDEINEDDNWDNVGCDDEDDNNEDNNENDDNNIENIPDHTNAKNEMSRDT